MVANVFTASTPLDSSQVVLQGTSLNYDDATVLDKLEYALRVGPSASERHLSQANVLPKVAVSCLDLRGACFIQTIFKRSIVTY